MKRFLSILVFCASVGVSAQEEEPGHMHGPDGRHIVAPHASGGAQQFILSHHDMRIEGPDGRVIIGCTVDSTIYKTGDPKAIVHTERNAYEPENEVYGSHMTYKEPGEYVLSQAVTLPDGKKTSFEFPVYVPAIAGGATEAEHAHGPNYPLIIGGVVGGFLLLFGIYRLGQKNARVGGAALLVLAVAGGASFSQFAWAQEDEKGHMHGADGRHIVAPDAAKASGPMLKAYPAPNQGDSAEKTVDGIKFVLSIENEEMTPDPALVAIGTEKAKLIGLKVAPVQFSATGGGLQTTGRVSANPNGVVIVNARAAGRVISLGALPGTSVRRGQALAVIESPELAEAQSAYRRSIAEISQAQASVKIAQSGIGASQTRLSVAQRSLDRQKQLAATGAFASPSVEAARSVVSTTEAELAAAQTNVQALEVRVAQLEQGVASGVVPRRELDVARAELQTARSNLADSQRQLTLAREALTRELAISAKGLRNAKEVESAQAEVDLARSALVSSRNGLLQAQADLTRAQSVIRIARDQIALLGGSPGGGNRVTISAPISGEVKSRTASVGQTVSTGEPLFDLLNAEVVWVLSDVFEVDVPKVRIGQRVEVVADALSGRTYAGEVAFVHNEVDESTRTTKVRVVVDNPGERLKQNMFVRVQIGTGSGGQILVPTSAVQTTGGVSVVYVEEMPGTYRRTVVQLGGALGDRTVIKSGLERGKKVVTDGAYQLSAIAVGG
ncbi:MAG: efflux RND transporter periplasmic adaptor subunit [Armatimonadetes bacterium]|nr:MAG: efflux RND transporter periplasmic adaptor subunit [Armatimonadota bacterium]